MASRSFIWFGVHIEDPPPEPPEQAGRAPARPPPPPRAAAAAGSAMEQRVQQRYSQQVSRRDFQQSALLLQYARERRTTPHLLWLAFMHHIQRRRLDNTLANLIEYLTVTAHIYADYPLANIVPAPAPLATGRHRSYEVVNNSTGDSGTHLYANAGVARPPDGSHPMAATQMATEGSHSMAARQSRNLSNDVDDNAAQAEREVVKIKFDRPPAYTHADFLKVKREAEKAFEMKLEAEERKRAEEEKKGVLRNINDMLN